MLMLKLMLRLMHMSCDCSCAGDFAKGRAQLIWGSNRQKSGSSKILWDFLGRVH